MWFRHAGVLDDVIQRYVNQEHISPNEANELSNRISKIVSGVLQKFEVDLDQLDMSYEDLMGEISKEIFKELPNYNPDKGDIGTFLYDIVDTSLKDLYRGTTVQKRIPQEQITSLFDIINEEGEGTPLTYEDIVSEKGPEEEMQAKYDMDLIRQRIEEMDPLAATILDMRIEEPDLTNQEIADRLNTYPEEVRRKKTEVIIPVAEEILA